MKPIKSGRIIKTGETLLLLPGEVWFGTGEGVLYTLLGSCVAMTIWHPRYRAGGMCHFLLPSRPGPQPAMELDGRYGEEAVRLLLQEAAAAGCDARECEIGLYGGGRMFGPAADDPAARNAALQVPQRNIEQARLVVGTLGLPVAKEHLGGAGHRQIRMSLADGEVRARQTPLGFTREALLRVAGEARAPSR